MYIKYIFKYKQIEFYYKIERFIDQLILRHFFFDQDSKTLLSEIFKIKEIKKMIKSEC